MGKLSNTNFMFKPRKLADWFWGYLMPMYQLCHLLTPGGALHTKQRKFNRRSSFMCRTHHNISYGLTVVLPAKWKKHLRVLTRLRGHTHWIRIEPEITYSKVFTLELWVSNLNCNASIYNFMSTICSYFPSQKYHVSLPRGISK